MEVLTSKGRAGTLYILKWMVGIDFMLPRSLQDRPENRQAAIVKQAGGQADRTMDKPAIGQVKGQASMQQGKLEGRRAGSRTSVRTGRNEAREARGQTDK